MIITVSCHYKYNYHPLNVKVIIVVVINAKSTPSASTRGSGAEGSVPADTRIIFAIGGFLEKIQTIHLSLLIMVEKCFLQVCLQYQPESMGMAHNKVSSIRPASFSLFIIDCFWFSGKRLNRWQRRSLPGGTCRALTGWIWTLRCALVSNCKMITTSTSA